MGVLRTTTHPTLHSLFLIRVIRVSVRSTAFTVKVGHESRSDIGIVCVSMTLLQGASVADAVD